MGSIQEDKERREGVRELTSSLKEPEWAKPWSWISRQLARQREWLRLISEGAKYPSRMAEIALKTDHWPDDVRECVRCGYPTGRQSALCKECREKEEDFRDEVKLHRTKGHF